MKKIILIGDSIRMGYDKYVKDALAGTAEVYYPEENCRFAQYTLRYLHDWKKRLEWPENADLVHWNAGLWDVAEIYGDEPMSSLAHYADMVRRIDARIRLLFPKAKIVFATSTAIREEGYTGIFKRHNAVIERFNATALNVLADTDTVINDLYAHTVSVPTECCSDMTHYNTPEGAAYMGNRVLSVICPLLNISASEIKLENFTLENYSADNIGF
ncbi:MAG: SGNH/GDSL hydrolase family protein [Clostridia bacterium]|nr:SGNH/GDSL hydrolase family protein [Clostridia bacterium]